MENVITLMEDIIDNGDNIENRTGTDTCSVFVRMLRFNLSDRFPAITTKKLAFKAVVEVRN